MKILLLLLLCILSLISCGADEPAPGDVQNPRQQHCYQQQPPLYSVAYFSEHYFRFEKFGSLEDNVYNISFMCSCQETFNQTFLISSYMNKQNESITYHDAIILCLNNTDNYQSVEIYDDYELLDTLLFERITSVPNSVLNPCGNDAHDEERGSNEMCYDWFGFPTKNILDQKTCLLAVDLSQGKNRIFSGPLLANELITFSEANQNGTEFSKEYCFTTTKDSIPVNQIDSCYYEISGNRTKFQCCCAQSPELCSPKHLQDKKKLFCFPGKYGDIEKVEDPPTHGDRIALKDYTENYINYACTITVTTKSHDGNSYSFEVEYGAADNCTDEVSYVIHPYDNEKFYDSNETKFCPYAWDTAKTVIMKKCCTDGHFCNHQLMPKSVPTKLDDYKKGKEYTDCYYKLPNIVFLTGDRRCDFFVDIWFDQQRVKMFLNYNVIEPEQKKYIKTVNQIEYQYVYLQIIKADDRNCTLPRYYKRDVNTYLPFLHAFCDTDKCDNATAPYEPLPQILFEKLYVEFDVNNNASNYIPKYEDLLGWICYVKIEYEEQKEKTMIQAGRLKDIENHVECLENDIMKEDGKFCCSHIFNVNQSDTICTVAKLIEKYKSTKHDEEITNSTYGHGNKYYTNCFIRGLPHDSCLAEAGCFETRLLEYSKNSDAIELAGCVDNTEKYITQDFFMASLSLGCRAIENSNRCSVVQTPDGHQRILCCCNGEECKNNLKEVPQKLGKTVSSFRSLH